MIRDRPAAIKVYPNMVCTIVLNSRCCGWADIAHPVIRITNPGMKFRFGRPSLFLLSHTPARPAHHHIIPIVVCWISFPPHGCPHLCSVNVLTHPHAAMSAESKNSCERPVRLIHACPTSIMIVSTIPYPMNALPMMKCARHCPRWSARQKPKAVIPPKSIWTHDTTGMSFPSAPCA
jgi:hypothetical protein